MQMRMMQTMWIICDANDMVDDDENEDDADDADDV